MIRSALDASRGPECCPQGLTILLVVVPEGVDLTTDDYNSLRDDEIGNRREWENDVDDNIREQDCA